MHGTTIKKKEKMCLQGEFYMKWRERFVKVTMKAFVQTRNY